jgi:membrane protein YfhO
MRGRSIRWETIVIPAAVVLLGLSFGLIPLFRGRLFFTMDNAIQHFPQTDFLVRALKSGVIPQWWPDVGAGSPVVAEGQAAHYHPIRLALAAVFGAPAALMGEVGICLALSGLGTHMFLSRIRLHPLASMAGALGFMFGSQCVVYVRSMALLRAGCLLPWVMWLAEGLFRGKSANTLWIAPPIIALQFLSGNPTFAVITLLGVVGYLTSRFVFFLTTCNRPVELIKSGAQTLIVWVLITVLGVGMAAVQVIPTLRHISQSERAGGLSLDQANLFHGYVGDLPQLLFPYAYELGDLTGAGQFNRIAATGFYDGALLAVAAFFCCWWVRRLSAPAWSLAVSGFLATLVSLGSLTPLFGLIWRLPVLGGMRFPVRYQFWASFCFACLGAIGLHKAIAWSRRRAQDATRLLPFLLITIVLSIGTAVFWQFQFVRHAGLIVSVLLLGASAGLFYALCVARKTLLVPLLVSANLFLLVDLSYFRLRAKYAATVPIPKALSKDGIAGWLGQDPGHFRIFSLITEPDDRIEEFRLQNTLTGSAPPLWDLQTVDYSFSLGLNRYGKVRQSLLSNLLAMPDQAQKLSRFLGFLQVKYVIAPRGVVLAGWDEAKREGGVTVWRNREFQEGGFLVGKVEREGTQNDELIVDEIRSQSMDFRQTAVIASAILPKLNGLGNHEEIRPVAAQYDEMAFRITSDRAALLVIPSNYYPGWEATVNGHPARIYRTNWIGMGVLVAAGESIVTMHFSTPGLHAGMEVSLLSLALWLAISVWARRNRTVAKPSFDETTSS